MRLTTRGRYAVTAMLDLAIYAKQDPVCLSDISKRQAISVSYLEQLFAQLRKNGLVKSVRGPGGGYKLNRTNDEIFILEIIDAINESVDATRCQGSGDCLNGQQCITHELWSDLSEQIRGFLGDISLGQLVLKRQRNQALKGGENDATCENLASETFLNPNSIEVTDI
ncbi:MAG: Fe-S cluster assembly transcriptional regulator IscR [Gammaproteobacteria bacterium]|nr:MAG: Fe-S cluster assembly transcriptional regulator IscR [Gammaproteobacteria bacterium]